MSRTPRFFIEKRKEDGSWEEVTLYLKNDKGEFEALWLDTGNADYDMFELIFDEFDGHWRSLPDDLSPSVSQYFDVADDDFPTMRESAQNTWYDYVELNLLAKTDAAVVTDYDAEPNSEGEYPKRNALQSLVSKIDWIVYENGIFYPNPGEVRIICSII